MPLIAQRRGTAGGHAKAGNAARGHRLIRWLCCDGRQISCRRDDAHRSGVFGIRGAMGKAVIGIVTSVGEGEGKGAAGRQLRALPQESDAIAAVSGVVEYS